MALGFLKELVGPVSGLVSEFIEDKDQANKLAHEIATLADKQHHAQQLAQLEVNKVEAAHKSLFVAGWRPAIGWVCGLGLLYNVLLHPILSVWVELPPVDTEALTPVMMGMLGLGAMRSYEKVQGVSREK